MKILLAEDDPEYQKSFTELLKMELYLVTLAKNGADALKLLKTKKYDNFITDNHMPFKNGIDDGISPKCNGSLVKRNGKYGNLWGCKNYPKCRFTIGS